MNYVNVRFFYQPLQPWTDILVAYLSDEDYESFTENDLGLNAYISEDKFNENTIKSICDSLDCSINFEIQQIKQKNWNAQWESSFEPVIIERFCGIRAHFHAPLDVMYEIIITPKMSFGTGHHFTTSGMIMALNDIILMNQRILDMGCGTGVLAILAEKMGSKDIVAIDIDEWAYHNTLENCQQNSCKHIQVKRGGSEQIEGIFNVILANINRNVLIKDLSKYSTHLEINGIILLSGFYESDLEQIKNEANTHSLYYESHFNQNDWVVARFIKKRIQ